MSTKFNLNSVPDYPVIEDQFAELQVDSLKEGDYNGRLTADVETHIVDGAAGWNGFSVRSRFFLGTEEDPRCERPETRRSRNWTKFKNFIKACGVAVSNSDIDMDELSELVQNSTVLGNIGHYAKKDAEGKPTDKVYNTVNSWHLPGSREIGLIDRKANGLDKSERARDMKAEAERMVPRRDAQPSLDDE